MFKIEEFVIAVNREDKMFNPDSQGVYHFAKSTLYSPITAVFLDKILDIYLSRILSFFLSLRINIFVFDIL